MSVNISRNNIILNYRNTVEAKGLSEAIDKFKQEIKDSFGSKITLGSIQTELLEE
jgi:hypothetical protein